MAGSLPAIPFDYLSLQDAARVLGVTERQLIHAAGTGALQLCVNIYARAQSIRLSRLEDDALDLDDAESLALSESAKRDMESQESACAAWLGRYTTPMPDGIFEIDDEIARYFEMPETDSVNLYVAYKFDRRGWWVAKFYDEETETGEPVLIKRRDIVVMRDEIARLLTSPRNTKNAMDGEMTPKREKTLLRIIRALDALAELPDRGATVEICTKLEGLGFDGPRDDTVREVLKAARALDSD